MSKNLLDLPEDSLASLDQQGYRTYLYPAQVRGFFNRYRNIVQAFLMLIFLVLPWVKIGGHQAVLLDLPNRRFAMFGLTFFAHDAPLFFFVLAALALTLTFVTAVWGRIWCGWACPQTVFIESIFRRIERWIEGNHLAQRRLDKAPLNWTKLWKKSLKWSLFIGATLIITHSFLAYFVGIDRLFVMVRQPPSENWASFLVMGVTSLGVLFDFGWFREQFCIIACPYGRFQSVLMDEKTINILYDETRGEPRRNQVPEGDEQGDCVSCYRCVQVCPTGVDIRRGVQMECIACTACIDACDEIMDKVEKPRGLIRYASEAELASKPHQIVRPRILVYLALIVVMISALAITTSQRNPIQITLLRAKEAPYRLSKFEDGSDALINHFKFHIGNQTGTQAKVSWELSKKWTDMGIRFISPMNEALVAKGETNRSHFFVGFPPQLLDGKNGALNIQVKVTKKWRHKSEVQDIPLKLLGPAK